jgi:hypothetical protein
MDTDRDILGIALDMTVDGEPRGRPATESLRPSSA